VSDGEFTYCGGSPSPLARGCWWTGVAVGTEGRMDPGRRYREREKKSGDVKGGGVKGGVK